MERNQYNPLRQTDDADEENPCYQAAHNVRRHGHHASRLRLGLAQRARNQRRNNRRQRAQPVEPVVEHSERSGPTEALDADNGNQIACEHGPRVGARRQFTQML